MLAIRLPVYRSDKPIETVAQRRGAYVGSVGSGFRVRETVQSALDETILKQMQFRLFEAGPVQYYVARAGAISDEHLLFDSKDLSVSMKPGKPDGHTPTSK